MGGRYSQYTVLQRLRNRERTESSPRIRHTGPLSPRVQSRRSERNEREQRRVLSVDARSFVPNSGSSDANPNSHLTPHQQQLGERLYPKVYCYFLLFYFYKYFVFNVDYVIHFFLIC